MGATLFQCGNSFQLHTGVTFVTKTSAPKVALQVTREDAAAKADEYEEPQLTDAGLPELKGDFDWDAKYAGDDDWVTEDVPGKITLDDITLAKQVTAMDQLETKWRRVRLQT